MTRAELEEKVDLAMCRAAVDHERALRAGGDDEPQSDVSAAINVVLEAAAGIVESTPDTTYEERDALHYASKRLRRAITAKPGDEL